MNIVNLLAIAATVAGSAMALSNVFQAVKIFQPKSAADVSGLTYVILSLGAFIWILYGISIKNFPIIISNGIGISITITIFISCIFYNKKNNQQV